MNGIGRGSCLEGTFNRLWELGHTWRPQKSHPKKPQVNYLALSPFIHQASGDHWNKYWIEMQWVTLSFFWSILRRAQELRVLPQREDFDWTKASTEKIGQLKSHWPLQGYVHPLFCHLLAWSGYGEEPCVVHPALLCLVFIMVDAYVLKTFSTSPCASGFYSYHVAWFPTGIPYLWFVYASPFHSKHLHCGFTVN